MEPQTESSELPLHWRRHRRYLPSRVDRAINSIFSTGPGYEPTPLSAQFSTGEVHAYYLDFSSKTRSGSAGFNDRLPNTNVIQLALGWWQRYVEGEHEAAGKFLDACRVIEERGQPGGQDELRWPTQVAVSKYRLTPPWCSALPQGQAASVFVRAFKLTSKPVFAELARKAVEPLIRESGSDLVTYTPVGPVLEEAPSTPPSHVLNGWISALMGIWDVSLGLSDNRAQSRFEGSLACLRQMLEAYDTGWWTLYSLYPHPVEDLAKPIYHRLHIAQVEALYAVSGFEEFRDASARWRHYDRARNRSAALLQKGMFSVLDGRRRRRWEDQPAGKQQTGA